MNLENIRRELEARGIEAEQVEVVKNGIECIGFRLVTDTNISPVVYYSGSETVESFMIRIEAALKETPTFDLEKLNDREYVMENLYVSVQRISDDEKQVKRQILNAEAILRVQVTFENNTESGSIRVTQDFLKSLEIPAEEAWAQAMANMRPVFRVVCMADLLGVPKEDCEAPFYVVTTETGTDGAAALLFRDIFRDFCRRHETESVVILPSSTQEILLLPEDEFSISYEELAHMVDEINRAQVDPVIQLDPVVYRFDLDSDDIGIVAEV